jgi:hypothetical protein
LYLPMPEDRHGLRVHTVLLPVKSGNTWRVQIIWPNGSVHYFGTFASERDAARWIKDHSWLTMDGPAPPSPKDRQGG